MKKFNKYFQKRAKTVALAAVGTAAFAGQAYGYDAATDDAAFGGITDRVSALLDGSGGFIIALISGGMALIGLASSNMKLVGGGVLTAITGGVIVGIVQNLHGLVI